MPSVSFLHAPHSLSLSLTRELKFYVEDTCALKGDRKIIGVVDVSPVTFRNVR